MFGNIGVDPEPFSIQQRMPLPAAFGSAPAFLAAGLDKVVHAPPNKIYTVAYAKSLVRST